MIAALLWRPSVDQACVHRDLQGPNVVPQGRWGLFSDGNELREQIRAGLGEAHKGTALMNYQAALGERQAHHPVMAAAAP